MKVFKLIFGLTLTLAVSSVSSFAPARGAIRSSRPSQHKQTTAPTKVVIKVKSLQASKEGNVLTENAGSIAVAFATFSTYILNNQMNLGPIKASSVVGLASAALLPEKMALAAFCGSFAGMARSTVMPTKLAAAALGIMCAIVMKIFDSQKWIIGFGGRLGFISQCACTMQFLIHKFALGGAIFGTTAAAAKVVEMSMYNTGAAALSNLPMLVFGTVAGAFFMRLWKKAVSPYSARFASTTAAVSATGLLASYFPIAGSAFCGSFVAMAAPTILPDQKALLLASMLAAVSQLGMAGVLLGGWGGKLGSAAFFGVLSYRLLAKFFGFVGGAVIPATGKTN